MEKTFILSNEAELIIHNGAVFIGNYQYHFSWGESEEWGDTNRGRLITIDTKLKKITVPLSRISEDPIAIIQNGEYIIK